jgi:hypothetical protein
MTRFRTLIALLSLAVAHSALRADDLSDLLKRVPGDMNTVAVINVREINKSPRAVREKWRDNFETEYLAGAMAVPPWVTVVVIGSELHPHYLAQSRSLALIPTENTLNSEVIARRENGSVQTVGDLTLVSSPQRGYFGFPAAGIVGISSTMPRQDFARWVRSARKPEKPAISQYLQDAIAAHKDAHIVVAMDLQDALDPTATRTGLQRSAEVPKESELDSLVNVLVGARGLVLTAQVDDKTKTELRFEFSVPMEPFIPAVKRIWPKALEAAGMEISELKTAEPKADGKAVVFTAELTDTSLRRLLSVVSAPGDSLEAENSTRISTPKDSAALAASLRYYRAVNSALDDLRAQGDVKGLGDLKGRTDTITKNYVRSATLFDTYAARIEKLPLVNVDSTLVQYGTSVAAKLRAMAASLRGAKVQLEVYDSYKTTTWAASPGAYLGPRGGIGVGGGNVALSTNVQDLSNKQAELVAKLEPERAKLWGILETDRSTIRREMLEKYKIDFEQYKR